MNKFQCQGCVINKLSCDYTCAFIHYEYQSNEESEALNDQNIQ